MPRVLCALLAAPLLLALAVAPASATPPDNLDSLRQAALQAVNQDRQEAGLEPLSLTDGLNQAAQTHADDMAERGYFAHEAPNGDTVADRYRDAGGSRWELVEENIARCGTCSAPPDEAEVDGLERGWMDSPEHRRNILAHGLTGFGFGIAVDSEDGLYAVQTFAGPGEPRGLSQGERSEQLDAQAARELALELVNEVRAGAGSQPLALSEDLSEAAARLLPEDATGGLQIAGDPFQALPADARGAWARLSLLAAACGGCGVGRTAADIRSFVRQWEGNAGTTGRLAEAGLTHAGFAMAADGEGRKTALIVLGSRRGGD